MKLRGTTAGTPFGAKLTALCWAALTLLAPVAVSACTSSSPTPPTIISPTVTNSPTATGATSASSGTSASGRRHVGVRHARRVLGLRVGLVARAAAGVDRDGNGHRLLEQY